MLSAVAIAGTAANAQRLSLYEEFTGENCGPCASTNPGLWTLMTGSGNPSKIMIIKYQVPIPSAGPIYNQYTTVAAARRTYYGVNSAPNGRIDGVVSSPSSASPGHPYYLTQSEINTAAGTSTPFGITTSYTYNATGDSITINVSITASSAFAPSGANLKLRTALIETMKFCSAPGSNGEKDFHNVVRDMYPDAAGTQLPNSWTASQTQNYTIKGKVKDFINKNDPDGIVVVWIQNDADKVIAQAAKATHAGVPTDVAITSCAAPTLNCASGATANVNSSVTIKNTGTTTLTSAKVFYKVDNGAYSATPASWSGTLAPGATTTVNLPAIAVAAGSHVIRDSVALPNGAADMNGGNNVQPMDVVIHNTTPNTLPISTGFENNGALPTGWTIFDKDGNGAKPSIAKATSGNIGHANSTWLLWFQFPYEASGETHYVILPQGNLPAGNKALDFWVAHALRTGASVDKLEVIYSTNCGSSWTTLWSKTGTDLATGATTPNNQAYSPAQADWKLWSVNVSSVPAGAMIAFRGIGASGQNMFVDDVNLRTGPAGVETFVANGEVSLFPNPAKESATLAFSLNKSSKIVINVTDAAGRTVATIADATLPQGEQKINIPTASLAGGLYNIAIQTEEGTITKRLTVVK